MRFRLFRSAILTYFFLLMNYFFEGEDNEPVTVWVINLVIIANPSFFFSPLAAPNTFLSLFNNSMQFYNVSKNSYYSTAACVPEN